MKIGIAFDLARPPEADGPDDRFEEFDRPETIDAVAEVIRGEGHDVRLLGDGREFLGKILADPPDFVFNMAEGEGVGRSREARVPAALEMLGIPYSGSDPLTLAACLDKVMAKRLLRTAADVTFPRGWTLPVDEDMGEGVIGFLYHESDPSGRADEEGNLPPLILKPALEGSSKGIRGKCLATSAEGATAIYHDLVRAYGQPILIEEYIAGDEVTVGLIGNNHPMQGGNSFVFGVMRIRPRVPDDSFVYSLEMKRNWRDRVDYEAPAMLPDPVVAAVTIAALDASAALGCRDVARIDFRVRDGVPYFIEANPLPGLAPGVGDLVILAEGHGIGHADLIRKILNASLARVGLK